MSPAKSTVAFPGLLAMSPPDEAARTSTGPAAEISAELRALTLAVRAGDAAAFTRFYDQYTPRIYRQLLVLAKGDEDVAREVFQTVAIKLARKLAVFEREVVLLAWLQQVARNAFIDHCRAHRRHRLLVSMDESSLDTLAAVTENRLHAQLESVLAECAPTERVWLEAIYLDGKTVAEAAAESGIPCRTFEARLARLREKLRRALT